MIPSAVPIGADPGPPQCAFARNFIDVRHTLAVPTSTPTHMQIVLVDSDPGRMGADLGKPICKHFGV